MSEFVAYNGQILPGSAVSVFPENRGMMYGDGCFETFRSYKGKFLFLEKHFNRMVSGLEYLGMGTPFNADDFRSLILELIKANGLQESDAIIRVQAWREGERGFLSESNQANWLTTCSAISDPGLHFTKLASVKTTAIPESSLTRKYKFSNSLNYIQAAREADALGGNDALMLTITGYVSETTIANIFWMKGAVVYTPSVECDLLPGITREFVIDLIHRTGGISVEEGQFTLSDLMEAEAFFCTNSIREIIPGSAIDTRMFDLSPGLMRRIKVLFEEEKQRQLS